MESQVSRDVVEEVAAVDLPKRSVIANADRISPLSKGINHFFCCSGLAYRASTSTDALLSVCVSQ